MSRHDEDPEGRFNAQKGERIVEARTVSITEKGKRYVLHVFVVRTTGGGCRSYVTAPEGVPLRWKCDKSFGLTTNARSVKEAVLGFLKDVRTTRITRREEITRA